MPLTDSATLMLQELVVEVQRKAIKNMYLAVRPPAGSVRVSAPLWMSEERIRLFVMGKRAWIQKQRQKLEAHRLQKESQRPCAFAPQEVHFVWGCPCQLQIEERDAAPVVSVAPGILTLQVRPGSDSRRKGEILEDWYRQILRDAALPRMAHWQQLLALPPVSLRIRRMKTRWGTCTPARRSILLNTELAKRPPECLEYLVVHELMHFFVPNHGPGFTALMDRHLPQWRELRKRLNKLPLGHEDWQGQEAFSPSAETSCFPE